MEFLVDSNIVIAVFNDEPRGLEVFRRIAQHPCSMSVITYMEIMEGILRFPPTPLTEQLFSEFLQDYDVLPVTQLVAHRCASIRTELRREGKRVRQRALDLLIAATAIEHNLTLVTRNQADYADIPGLSLFNEM